jgi:hypothetical protein
VELLVRGVLQELLGDRFGVEALSHEVMALIAQDADDLGGKNAVEESHGLTAVQAIGRCHDALLHVLAGAPPYLLDVAEKGTVGRVH